MNKDEAIKRLRTALRTRTGREWSVSSGHGESREWIVIQSPVARRVDREGTTDPAGKYLTAEDQGLLVQIFTPILLLDDSILGSKPVSGLLILPSNRQEYVQCAEDVLP